MNNFEYKEAVEAAVSARNFYEAFRLLRVMLPGDAVRLRAALESAQEDYKRIVDYALTGLPDPSRQAQISALTIRIYNILDMLLRENLVAEHSSLYFNVTRTLRLRRGETLDSLLREYSNAVAALSPLRPLNKQEKQALRRNVESLEERVFDRLWTTLPLTFDEVAQLRTIMSDLATPESIKSLIVGALTMSLLQFFNEQNLRLLLDFAGEQYGAEVQIRATVGAVLAMARWPQRSNSSTVTNQLAALRENGTWSADVEQAILQIIRTADVEKISRTMREEIIPEMMKLRPDLEKHIKENGFDPADMEANPEWEDLLDKSGLTERLRKFSELQSEGGDIFYAAFTMLKNYPFFNHISHWFLPFDPERNDVVQALGHDAALAMMLGESLAMCGSDKYSFVLSLDRLPEMQKQAVMNQLSEANIKLAELAGAELLPEKAHREGLIRAYIQDLYRFFNLFRRCGEFVNPFKQLINPAAIPALKDDFREPDKIRLLGEFYFKHNHMAEALALFKLLTPDLTLHQKMGLAQQRLGNLPQAVVEYERAEMLAPDSEWTLRKLAHINKTLGKYDKALTYFERLEQLAPDQPENALQMGYCYIELNQLHEALHCCYKAEMLDEKSAKPLRPIAWCALLSGDYDTARRYYERLFSEQQPDASDFLNMGHLELATANMSAAMACYKQYSPDINRLAKAIATDRPTLERAGIDTSALPLLLDALRFQS